MYKNKSITVVIPCYNEGTQIQNVIKTIPEYVDKIVIVDDYSEDYTVSVVQNLAQTDSRIKLIRHTQNAGCGGALATGYIWARDNDSDVAVRMDGDGQMDPEDLKDLLDPVVTGQTDYSKGNRLYTGEAFKLIPKARYFGNSVLTLLTKIASGYWHVADSQSGYTAMNRDVLRSLDWRFMYTRYGQPNHLLIMLNVLNFRVRDIPVKPVYGVGEESGIKVKKVIFTLSWLLFKNFFWRMKEKYFIRDFHPLIFFYLLGFSFYFLTAILFVRLFYRWWLIGSIPPINALSAMFAFMSASLFTLFAMWFDMEANKDLK
ncbi:MAG: ribonuclease BN [Candidatus Marinimicrobia bacterium]|nr:ribonuclease BN [Candidatus Neomarinimicrobiota bacterium]|tara:strand:+ start:40252 stop:41199 length:948 start_codon:yes stop_codon:yes gene_type:complete